MVFHAYFIIRHQETAIASHSHGRGRDSHRLNRCGHRGAPTLGLLRPVGRPPIRALSECPETETTLTLEPCRVTL